MHESVVGLCGDRGRGAQLNEGQVDAALALLLRFDALVFLKIVDVGIHPEGAITQHKERQADKLTENLTDKHQATLVAQLKAAQAVMKSLSDPLYIQLRMTTEAVIAVIHDATLYWVLRCPSELGSFHWTIDAKDCGELTEYEQLWSDTVLFSLQTRSFEQPFPSLEGADYSHFERFHGTLDDLPDYLRPALPEHEGPLDFVNPSLILKEDLRFADSGTEAGLQLVDIVATTMRRALVGNIGEDGWLSLGPLLLNKSRGPLTLSVFDPDAPSTGTGTVTIPYKGVLSTLNASGRDVFEGVDTSALESREKTMSDTQETQAQAAPWHLWLVGVLALLWGGMGALDYVVTQTKNEAYMGQFTPEQLEFFYGFPAWVIALWAIAVWGGVLGAVLLLLRKRLAVLVFLVSLISMVITAFQNYVLSNAMDVNGTFGLVFSAVIFVIGVLEIVYARAMSHRGVLT